MPTITYIDATACSDGRSTNGALRGTPDTLAPFHWFILGCPMDPGVSSSSIRGTMGQGKRSICLAVALATLPLAAGCRVNEGDVKRWEQTQRGPYKLVAVITHDKYPLELRTDAAMSLIRMPPRGGTRQGIGFLVDKYK